MIKIDYLYTSRACEGLETGYDKIFGSRNNISVKFDIMLKSTGTNIR